MTRKPLGGVRKAKRCKMSQNVRTVERGMQLHFAGDPEGALAHYAAVLRRDLNAPLALYFAALAKHQLGHDAESAIPYMLKCLSIAPNFADGWLNLGKFYFYSGQEDKAYMAYMAALEHNQEHTESLVSVGDHEWLNGNHENALGYWQAAIATTPRCPEAAHYRAFARIRFGDPGGWEDYEARWQCRMYIHTYGREEYQAIPLWIDQDLMDKRLIVHSEQGHGDVIQCARYLPLLRDRGARVILEAHKPLVRLMQQSFPWVTVFERGTVYPDLVDLQVPSFSLPHRFGGVNPNGAYLTAPASDPDIAAGRARIERQNTFRVNDLIPIQIDRPEPPPDRLRVAVAWRGSKTHVNDRHRSCPVEQFAPLWSLPGIEWISLQIGEAAAEADGTPMRRVDDRVKDFADSADIIASCDLTLSVDTAVAHLAGALGARVWMMTPPLSEWRWGLVEPTTPLYPSMRIFRQPTRGDWAGVVGQIKTALMAWVEGR